MALAFWPWSLLAQAEPLPERLLTGAPDAVIAPALSSEWGPPAETFAEEERTATPPCSATASTRMLFARSIGPPLASTETTTPRAAGRADAPRARCWLYGAPVVPCRPGTPT